MGKLPQYEAQDFELDDSVPMGKARWHGSTVEVTTQLVPRYLWTTASIDVSLDGRCILRTGGQMKVWGSSSAEFDHDGSVHTVELSWGLERQQRFPDELKIDGAKVAVADVPVANVGMLVIPALTFLSSLALVASRL